MTAKDYYKPQSEEEFFAGTDRSLAQSDIGMAEDSEVFKKGLREGIDYTKWRQEYFGDVSSEVFQKAAVAYGKENPL